MKSASTAAEPESGDASPRDTRHLPELDMGVAGDELSVTALLNTLLRKRRAILGFAAVLSVAVGTWTLLQPRTHTATAAFVPQGPPSRGSRLSALAAQFGVAIPQGEAGESPRFYADLLRSREILGAVVETEFEFVGVDRAWFGRDSVERRGSLMDLFAIEPGPAAKRKALAIRELGSLLSVRTDAETGIVSASISLEWPELAQQILARLLELVNQFNLQTRQTQAAAERRFVEGRLEEAQAELMQAEEVLESFLQRNRAFSNSPQLQFEHDRLQRVVAQRQQVVNSLTVAFEQARIDEVRDTPVITIVEPPQVPALPDRRRLVLKVVMALVIGATVMGILAISTDFVRRSESTEPNEFAEFQKLKGELVGDLRSMWSLAARPLKRSRGTP